MLMLTTAGALHCPESLEAHAGGHHGHVGDWQRLRVFAGGIPMRASDAIVDDGASWHPICRRRHCDASTQALTHAK